MARSNQWETPEMAEGDPAPAWPLPDVPPKFATWSFGGGRPFGCKEPACERWHAGIDLTGAPDRAIVVAPERARVTGVDKGWSGDSKAIYLEAPGLFIVLGGLIKNSPAEFGVETNGVVPKGAKVGRVLGAYGMIHLETYRRGTTKNLVWRTGKPPPSGLLNPTNYVERAAGRRPSLLRTVQRHQALAALGFYQGGTDAVWGTASKAALQAAQASLGVDADGIWGPETEAAIVAALEKHSGPISPTPGDPAPSSSRLGLWIGVGVGAVGLAGGLAWYLHKRSA